MSTNWNNIQLPQRNTAADLITALLSGVEGYQQGAAAKQKSNYEALTRDRQRQAYEGRGMDPNIASLDPQLQKEFFKAEESPKKQEIVELLKKQGIDQDTAELYVQLTQGGQTEFAKAILDNYKRGKSVEPASDMIKQPQTLEEIVDYRIAQQDTGITPQELERRSIVRENRGSESRSKARTQIQTAMDNKRRFSDMQRINQSDNLPKGLGRLLLDSDGNPRWSGFSGLLSKDAQVFQKNLAELINGAKNTFGSRVTNFDIVAYMRQFPSLLNTQEGREEILKRLQIINDINSVHAKNLDKVYRMAGGARFIDEDIAQEIADDISEKEIGNLLNKFSMIGVNKNNLGDPVELSGKFMIDDETGTVFVAENGEWRVSSIDEYNQSKNRGENGLSDVG